jgi:hypothetical protein
MLLISDNNMLTEKRRTAYNKPARLKIRVERGNDLKKEIRLDEIVAHPGEKLSGFMRVIGAALEIPVTLICGKQEGPLVLITAGIHNAEAVGIQAAMELREELDAGQLCGDVVILPLVNRTGFEHRTMSMVYEDGKNLNRVFPGRADGTLAEQIAYTMSRKLFSIADYYIDLHCGDGYEDLYPHVYTLGAASARVNTQSESMADVVNVAYRYATPNPSGGAYNHAGSMGVPGILLERGCKSLWSRAEVEADKEDVRNILRLLGVLPGPVKRQEQIPYPLNELYLIRARHTGLWYPSCKVGERFQKGTLLGTIRNYFGTTLEEYHAEVDGVLLYQTITLNILTDDPMVVYGKL